MNYFAAFACTLTLGQLLVPLNVLCKLNAVIDFHPWYVNRLYLEENRNRASPEMSDPAISDRFARLRVCEDISNSGVFAANDLIPVAMEDVYNDLDTDIFQQVFRPSVSQNPNRALFEYYNPYKRRDFYITKRFPNDPSAESLTVFRKEFTFLCLLKVAERSEEYHADGEESDEEEQEQDTDMVNANTDNEDESSEEDSDEKRTGDVVVFYVTKLYDARLGMYAHRFIFPERGILDDVEVMLVRHSANAYIGADFDIESLYLELRRNRELVSRCQKDPVCRLNLGYFEENKRFELCAIVLKSAYFEDKFEYPHRVHHTHWIKKKVSFQTSLGRKRATARSYTEFMISCETNRIGGSDVHIFFISWAYNSYQVFVYTVVERKHYLETLLTDVSIVYEPNHD